MCGIIGYIGDKRAVPYLLEGLGRLEYRGYDSAGIATMEESGIEIIKAEGRLHTLESLVLSKKKSFSRVGIGHTRWATHGRPSTENAHPHISENGSFALVHNGIIENYAMLKKELENQGVTFKSETDTEVIVQLLEKNYDGDFLSAVNSVTARLEGSYALCILCRDFPDRIVCVRMGSPLVVAFGDEGVFVASDILAVSDKASRFCRLERDEIVELFCDGAVFYNRQGEKISKEASPVKAEYTAPEKKEYEHYMLKEIYEQPLAVRRTIQEYLSEDGVSFPLFEITKNELMNLRSIYIVACGSAGHVGVCGKYIIEALADIPCHTDIASEFRYRASPIDERELCIIISQSGETADSIAALKKARQKGARVLSVVNVEGSTIAEMSDYVIYTRAGAEIAVATTKAYSAQLAVMYCLGVYFGMLSGRLGKAKASSLISEIASLPEKTEQTIKSVSRAAADWAERLYESQHLFFIGRGTDYAVALEGSLKLKEISYIHSEAYGAGELKHGTISLIEKGTPVICLMCDGEVYSKTLSNLKEVRSRGGEIFAVTTSSHSCEKADIQHLIAVPDADRLILPSLEVIPLQLVSYYTALKRGCDIDKPRNLAKSVTVE